MAVILSLIKYMKSYFLVSLFSLSFGTYFRILDDAFARATWGFRQLVAWHKTSFGGKRCKIQIYKIHILYMNIQALLQSYPLFANF